MKIINGKNKMTSKINHISNNNINNNNNNHKNHNNNINKNNNNISNLKFKMIAKSFKEIKEIFIMINKEGFIKIKFNKTIVIINNILKFKIMKISNI